VYQKQKQADKGSGGLVELLWLFVQHIMVNGLKNSIFLNGLRL